MMNDYYSRIRYDIIKVFPEKVDRVLDVGCGTGETSKWLKENGRCRWAAGIELDTTAAMKAQENLDVVYKGNVETIELPIEKNSIDVIVCTDILEHIQDPWTFVSKLSSLLKENGIIISSIPNVRYWKVSAGLLLMGRWNYKDQGILDRSHLRFFVRDSMKDLFHEAGCKIKNIGQLGPQREYGLLGWIFDVLTFGIFSDLLTVQYLIVAEKTTRV